MEHEENGLIFVSKNVNLTFIFERFNMVSAQKRKLEHQLPPRCSDRKPTCLGIFYCVPYTEGVILNAETKGRES